MQKDVKVSRKLRSEGWLVLRFWEYNIEKNPEKYMRKIIKKAKNRNLKN